MKTLLSFILLVSSLIAFAQPVPYVAPKRIQAASLAWDPSPSPGVVATIIRRGTTSGQYIEQVTVPVGTNSYTWTNLTTGTSYFVVTAITDTGIESLYSNEVSVNITLPLAPNFRSAVPITVQIYRRENGILQAQILELGPFYDLADLSSATYESTVTIGSPLKVFPK